jgi:hypothetical protein
MTTAAVTNSWYSKKLVLNEAAPATANLSPQDAKAIAAGVHLTV